MLEAALLWYRKFRRDIEEIVFEFNPYYSCVGTRDTHDKQQTIRFHINDMLSSHKNSEVNKKFSKWAKEKYRKLKPVEVKQGKVHTFLGMTLDFSIEGKCHVQQEECIDDILGAWLESVLLLLCEPAGQRQLYRRRPCQRSALNDGGSAGAAAPGARPQRPRDAARPDR